MRAAVLIAAAVAVVAIGAGAARADRIVLIAPPAALARAAHDQLAPYRIDVVIADAAPSDASAARALAGRYQARAVAWLDGGALVVFDAIDGSTAQRPAPTPLDDAGAAALALTLKTVLRERWAIEDAAPPPPWPELDLAIAGGLRAHGGAAEPRVGLGLDWRPGPAPILVGVRGSLGGGVGVHADGFSGTWNDRGLGALALYPWSAGPFELRGGAGGSLKWTAIHGVLLPGGGAAQDRALDVGFDAEADALWRRPPIALGLRAAATWVPWRQRYTVADLAVFEVSHVEAELDLLVVFTL